MAGVYDDPDLIRRAVEGDVQARNELVILMRPLVFGLALKIGSMLRSTIDAEELVQVGLTRVILKFEHFRPEMGYKILTYFSTVAWRAMYDYASRDSVIVPPSNWATKKKDKHLVSKARFAKSLDQMTCADEVGQMIDVGSDARGNVQDHRESAPEAKASASEAKAILAVAIKKLPRRLRKVITLRLEGKTLAAIGAMMRLSRERIRQMENEAKSCLRLIITGSTEVEP